MSLLDQAHNLRRLVVSNDDSGVSSSAYPLRNSARRDVQEGSAGPPFVPASRIEGQSLAGMILRIHCVEQAVLSLF
jgi:hypothetical protein